MTDKRTSDPIDIHSEAFLRDLMRRQLKLSISCATAFVLILIGLPLMNYFYPELMATSVCGFTFTWLFLGVLVFPIVWVISWIFIQRSIALEDSEVHEVEASKNGGQS